MTAVPTPNGGVKRVLVIELWNIGDVILAMPFLAQLRRVFPGARITLAAKSFASDLLAGTGLVDEIIVSNLSWHPDDRIGFHAKLLNLFRASRTLRAGRFDIAFSGRSHLRERVLLWLSGARRRVAHSGSVADPLVTDAIHGEAGDSHRVERWLALLSPFGGPVDAGLTRLHVTDAERDWARDYLRQRGVGEEELVIAVHPGASVAEKRWPMDRFREVTAAVSSRPGVKVLAVADPGGYGTELFSVPGVIPVQVSLRQLVALLSVCDILVCNDSGPMHIAGAVGVTAVALFGNGIADAFAPLGTNHELLHPPAGARVETMASGIRSPVGIGTKEVLDAVDRALLRLETAGPD